MLSESYPCLAKHINHMKYILKGVKPAQSNAGAIASLLGREMLLSTAQPVCIACSYCPYCTQCKCRAVNPKQRSSWDSLLVDFCLTLKYFEICTDAGVTEPMTQQTAGGVMKGGACQCLGLHVGAAGCTRRWHSSQVK